MYILLIVTSSFVFQPKSFNMIPFPSKKLCEQALIEAKKQWSTINFESKCIDLEKQEKIKEQELILDRLKNNKE